MSTSTGRSGARTADLTRRAVAVLGAALAGSGVAACSGGTVPADDEYAGRAATTTSSPTGDAGYWAGDADEEAAGDDGAAGPYADGTYTATARYGPIREDAVTVTVALTDGLVTELTVDGDALLPQSADYQSAFVAAVEGVVVGRELDDAHVDVLAGASKTSATFNRAIDDIREQAAAAGAGQDGATDR